MTMKTILILLTMLSTVSIITSTQQRQEKESEVPEMVIKAFTERYDGTNLKKWKHRKETFIAKFSSSGRKYETTFLPDGSWVQTECAIKMNELPGSVQRTYYESDYRWLHMTSSKELQTPTGKLYLIEGDNSNEDGGPMCNFKLWFNESGEMVKEESNC